MPNAVSTQPNPIERLKDEFRRHLEFFYARLQLAPPYESVEKAIRVLTTAVHALSREEQMRVLSDSSARWEQFQAAFDTSGLARKHRGIISGLVRNRSSVDLPSEYDHFLDLFRS